MAGVGTLGINGLGRIGKLTVWYEVAAGRFNHLVVNPGRQVGKGIEAVAHYLSSDSTYGSLGRFLHGHAGPRNVVEIVDRERGLLSIDGVRVTVLTENRNPKDIGWADHGAALVVDTTGKFRDPTAPPDHSVGSLQGHLESGAKQVVVSSAFKIQDTTAKVPDDSVMLIYGINHQAFDPSRHCLVSAKAWRLAESPTSSLRSASRSG